MTIMNLARVGDEVRKFDAMDTDGLIASFYMRTVEDEAVTKATGTQAYKEQEFITILTPGDANNIIDRPVWEVDKKRFAKLYTEFLEHKEVKQQGTPLSGWPRVSKTQVKTFEFYNCFTVEQLASMSDENGKKFPDFHKLKSDAVKFLDALQGQEASDNLRKELSQRDAELNALRAALKDQGDQIEQLRRNRK